MTDMTTRQIYEIDDKLLRFMDTCNQLGYKNNDNAESLKFQWCIETGGAWWATYDNNDDQVSMSGIHPYKDGYRALFRGAQVHSRKIGLARHHMQSHCFYYELPEQIKFANDKPVYITTSFSSDASGMMNKIDKIFHHLEKSDVVNYCYSELVYGILQNVWLLNKERYFEVRNT